MAIFLDNQPFADADLAPEATVGQLIDTVKATLTGSGRLLISLRCEDEPVSPERLESILPDPIRDFHRLDLQTDEPKQVVLDILTDAQQALSESFATLKDASESLSAGDQTSAMNHLADCMQSWGQVHDALVKGGSLLGIDFNTLSIAERPLVAWIGDILTRLRDLKEAIASRDHVLLADLLRYEFDDMLQGWERLLEGFVAHIEGLPASAGAAASAPTP